MHIEHSSEEVQRISHFGMRTDLIPPQDLWGFRSSDLSHILFPSYSAFYFLYHWEREKHGISEIKSEITWPVPHLQVKNLGSEKVSALPY